MTNTDLKNKLDELLKLPSETEVFEFKEAKSQYDFDNLGQYFSALCNEANLKGKNEAWLIFGVQDKGRVIVGSNYRKHRKDLDSLKNEIANKTTNHITFIEIHELDLDNKRVVMFQIPAAPKGIPVGWGGHFYGRDGESLVALNTEEYERIRKQSNLEDWSADVIPNATIDDLDASAITMARNNYKDKFPEQAVQVDSWDDTTFLNKAKILIKGKITRAAILLLGKPESEHYVSPAEAKIRWVLKDARGNEMDYQIWTCPFLLAIDGVFSKIRNLKYRYLKDGTLFPEETLQYEPYVIREALNNCIAHQDYSLAGRINVVEKEDELIFTNLGKFIPGSVEHVINENAPEEHYQNRFLVNAMFNLKMVDTIGSGIRRMHVYQRQRFFPMPEYDISPKKISVTITGKVLDLDYARALARNPELSLQEIIMLDKVQKHKPLANEEVKHLKERKLIEGRKPNFYISEPIAKTAGQKAQYSKNKAFEKKYYLDLILKAIEEHGTMERKEIDELLWKKLPDWMDEAKKKKKISNLLTELRTDGRIDNNGSYSKPKWILKA